MVNMGGWGWGVIKHLLEEEMSSLNAFCFQFISLMRSSLNAFGFKWNCVQTKGGCYINAGCDK